MNESVKQLVTAMLQKDAMATESAFQSAMAEKISAKLDDLRVQVAQNMFNAVEPELNVEESVEFTQEEWDSLSEEEQSEYNLIEASNSTNAGLQTRMNKNFTKSVATRYDGTRKQEAQGKKALVKTAKIIKSRGGNAAAAKQKASDKNDHENEM
jgi:hypothetical protein